MRNSKNEKMVRCSYEEISSLELGVYKDFGHIKLYTTKLSPKQVEKILNDYLTPSDK